MKHWKGEEGPWGERGHRVGEFLRSLLSGIPWSESAESEETHRTTAPKGGLLRVNNPSGRIQVVGEDRDDVEVLAAKRARAESEEAAKRLLESIRLVETDTADTLDLEIEVPRKWNRRGHVNLELRVPRRLRVHCEAVNGKLCLFGLHAPVRARSTNGSVSVVDVLGDVEIYTSNAKVVCAGTCGRLVARSSNGKIELKAHRGSVDASTSNGLIRAVLEELGEQGVRLATSNGRIVIELPDDVDADVDVRVDNGMIRTERPLDNATRASRGRVRGTLGRGGIPVKLRTSNGSVSVR